MIAELVVGAARFLTMEIMSFSGALQMGGKPSHALGSNRPESGGADRDMIQEKSGLLDREKNEFAASQKEKEESLPEHPKDPDGDRKTGDVSELQY